MILLLNPAQSLKLDLTLSFLLLQQEEDVPHPIKVNNWAPDLKVGQISAVAVNQDDQPVIFQRGPVEWVGG